MKNFILFLLLIPTVVLGQLELPYSVKVVNPLPLDFFYYESDGTPYDNTGEVTTAIPLALRYQGMTVNVNGVDYWFGAGTADGNLAIKIPTLTFTNGITNTAGSVGLGGTMTANTTFTSTLDVTWNTRLFVVGAAGATTEPERLTVIGDIIEKGNIWTAHNMPNALAWQGVTYGEGLFVAVASSGTGNRTAYSYDGWLWTTGDQSFFGAPDNAWQDVAYGNGVFVAIANTGSGDRAMYSMDGKTWLPTSTPADNNWAAVAFGNGVFVAVASSGTTDKVMTSTDGWNWTIQTSTSDTYYDVAFGNGVWLAITSSELARSTDNGVTWTDTGSTGLGGGAFGQNSGIAYGNGIWMGTATATNTTAVSSDNGTTWTGGKPGNVSGSSKNRVLYAENNFIQISENSSGGISTTPNGVNTFKSGWVSRTITAQSYADLAYGNGMFVTVCNSGTNRVWTSGKTRNNDVFSEVRYGLVNSFEPGYVPIAPGNSAVYLDGTGNWSTPAGGGGGGVDDVTITQPAAGITVTNSGTPQTGNAAFTLALADDLSALEAQSGTGMMARTASNTYAHRTVTSGNSTITMTNGNGVSGNPTLTANVATNAELNTGSDASKIIAPSIFATSKYPLESQSVSTAGGTITLDYDLGNADDAIQKIFIGSASFAGSKTIALSNATNALVFSFHFTVTNVAATLVCPASFTMSSVDWNSGSDTWTPPATGAYEMTGTFDGTNWRVNISGPFN